jgi:hypothetical protein
VTTSCTVSFLKTNRNTQPGCKKSQCLRNPIGIITLLTIHSDAFPTIMLLITISQNRVLIARTVISGGHSPLPQVGVAFLEA